jgi:transposase-like protein
MCDVLDRAERRGAEKKAREAAINLYKMGMAAEDIAKVLNEALSTVQQWLGIASA